MLYASSMVLRGWAGGQTRRVVEHPQGSFGQAFDIEQRHDQAFSLGESPRAPADVRLRTTRRSIGITQLIPGSGARSSHLAKIRLELPDRRAGLFFEILLGHDADISRPQPWPRID
jgi:hypothetical protein